MTNAPSHLEPLGHSPISTGFFDRHLEGFLLKRNNGTVIMRLFLKPFTAQNKVFHTMHPPIPDRQRRYTLFVLVLVFTSSHIDRQIMGILGQPIKESLLISDTQLGLLTGIMFAVFYATLGMPMAMWADRHNRRNLISFSVFLWSLMTALCGQPRTLRNSCCLELGSGWVRRARTHRRIL
jgi:hypothetical protein